MKYLVGAVRITLAAAAILGGALPTLLLSLAPWRYRGARVSGWFVTLIARAVNWSLGVRLICTNWPAYTSHRGLIFCNHSSLLDPIELLALSPVRFVAARETRRIPGIGILGDAVENVWLERRDKGSRRKARASIGEVLKSDPYPPVALFPEGRLGPGHQLMPFRYGGFELAVEHQASYLLCALRFDNLEAATWHGGTTGESLYSALWRLATSGGVTVELIPISVTRPSAADDAALLATVAQRAVERTLGFEPGPSLLDEAPPAQWQIH